MKSAIVLTLLLSLTSIYSLPLGNDPKSDISEYFRAKHVIGDAHTRRQLLSKTIPDTQKIRILERYVNKPFNAWPDPDKMSSPERKPWKSALGAKSATSFIVADQRKITNLLRAGTPLGADSKGNPLVQANGQLPMIKAKVLFDKQNPTFVNGFQQAKIKPVEDGKGLIRNENFGASFNNKGKANHFEAASKLLSRLAKKG